MYLDDEEEESEFEKEKREVIDIKNKGDRFRQEKKYNEAINEYKKSIDKVKKLEKKFTKEEMDILIREALGPSLLNISYIEILNKNWAKVIDVCSEVLKFDYKPMKANYRRCIAYINSNMLDQAKKDLDELMDIQDKEYMVSELNLLNEMYDIKKKEEDEKKRPKREEDENIRKREEESKNPKPYKQKESATKKKNKHHKKAREEGNMKNQNQSSQEQNKICRKISNFLWKLIFFCQKRIKHIDLNFKNLLQNKYKNI